MISEANKRREQCQNQARTCQSKFPVLALTSREWLQQQQQQQHGSWIMVDVRTNPERNVSMIRGAITLEEFNRDFLSVPKNAKIAFYCTIGYRSGIHATQCLRRYRDELDGRVFNLDGMVAFSQAVVDQTYTNQSDDPWLIEPQTGEPASSVHTFGSLWNFVDTEVYSAISYSPPMIVIRMLQVGGMTFMHHLREGLYMSKCLASNRRKQADKNS